MELSHPRKRNIKGILENEKVGSLYMLELTM